MTLSTLPRFLVGERRAVDEIIACPQAPWIGLLFVLSAGLAREYDGADLVHEPWHLLLPVGASLATSFVLFCFLWSVTAARSRGIGKFWETYRQFLALYWMTAPLAWIYAIPVEQFGTPAEAVQLNLLFLTIVAVWRVVLITRAAGILLEFASLRIFFPVMLFADALALVMLFLTPIPIVPLMGGVPLVDGERTLFWFIRGTQLLGVVSLPVWLMGSILVAANTGQPTEVPSARSSRKPMGGAWVVAALAVAIWLPVLAHTQPAQILAWEIDSDFQLVWISHEPDDQKAFQRLSTHERRELPARWSAPPRDPLARVRGGHEFQIYHYLFKLAAIPSRPWVREMYLRKLRAITASYDAPNYFWTEPDDTTFDLLLTIMEEWPEAEPFVIEQWETLKHELSNVSRRTESQKERIRELEKRYVETIRNREM